MTDTIATNWFADVLAFHAMKDSYIGMIPAVPPPEVVTLRANLEEEEWRELQEAVGSGDLAGVADAIADLVYVLVGRAISYGIDLRPVWAAVHAANMAKAGAAKRVDGKILKPEGWVAPDVAGVLARQKPL